MPTSSSTVNPLPRDLGSLTRRLPPAAPGTLFVLGPDGGVSVSPGIDFPIVFGRNERDVHVCVGVDDRHVSRRHGHIAYEHPLWVLSNLGRLPIQLPGRRLLFDGDRAGLPGGYTPLFIVGPGCRHLLEVRIAARGVVSV